MNFIILISILQLWELALLPHQGGCEASVPLLVADVMFCEVILPTRVICLTILPGCHQD